ncbi:MAG TPA: GAF domain-containing protein, partial [Candidatus Saccharimonadales bacterium]|nr:GAF domain-containing protein [Candidatus Saccharimonadales bacterium]
MPAETGSSTDLARQLGLVRDVGIALTRAAPLAEQLDEVARALVEHLDAAFARVWSLRPGETVLKLQASAGQYTHLDGGHSEVPVGMFKIGLIAAERVPHLTNDVPNDPRVSDQAWAAREGMIAFAGYPLMVGERVVGVMALFAKHQLSDGTLAALALIARQLALRIDSDWTDEARQAQRRQLLELFAELPVLIASTLGPAHMFTLANPLFVRVAGDRTLLGRPAREAFSRPSDAPFLALLDDVFATGRSASENERPVLLDRSGSGVGEPAYLNFTYQPIVAGGKVEGV